MKKLMLVLLLLCSAAFAQTVSEEVAYNNGQMFIRIHNTTQTYYSCYYIYEVNYLTFSLAPRTTSGWQPVYGYYEWQCN